MKRTAMQHLISWKEKPARKPLLIRGARQVGKTWLMQEFGKNEYEQTVYVNFERTKMFQALFKEDFNIERIINALQIFSGIQITPHNTLIIFDELQEAEGAITALKYFYEDAPEYHIVSAGSLLGVAMHKRTSFPVGKVEFLDLHPLSFIEFLMALGQEALVDLLKSRDWVLVRTFKTKLIHLLRQYYYIGGMPEAVFSFSLQSDFQDVREIQKRILISYEQDFSKHAPPEIVPRIRMLWNSIPSQLAKENKKFIYGAIKQGSRSKDYELALSWLIDCGLVYKINRVSKPGIPLKAYEDSSAFKLFIHDTGLLAAMGDMDVRTLIDGNIIFTEFKDALTEQYVLQQLLSINDMIVFYWSAEKSSSEIDFVLQHSGRVIPVEVKAEENLQAKSLKSFFQKFSPSISIRTSMSDYREDGWLTNVPLYAISEIVKV
jgi:predicted AAA+ superfamily ATPase